MRSNMVEAAEHLRVLMLSFGVDPKDVTVTLRAKDGDTRCRLEAAIHRDLQPANFLSGAVVVPRDPGLNHGVQVAGLRFNVRDLDASRKEN